MSWNESATSFSTDKTVTINKQDALKFSAFQPYLTFVDSNAGNAQSRIQGPDGKLVFYVQSAFTTGVPTVIFNTLTAPAGQPQPSAVEIHAQDGIQTVGYQPYLTLTDTNAGYAKARIQSADGKLVFYTRQALNVGLPSVIFNSIAEVPGQPLPSAVEIHAQDGVQTVGYQPFVTLTDSNAGYAKARVQNADGNMVLYTQGGITRAKPEMILDSASGNVQVTGTMKVDVDIVLTGADCAERFDLADQRILEAGTVVVIDEDGMLRESSVAYDRRVAGVIAGAGDYRPGIIMGAGASDRVGAPVALVGRTFCKVDATFASIEVGDLLVSSPTAGHAMKASDSARAFGAVIGKALRPLKEGMGLIPILVALQ